MNPLEQVPQTMDAEFEEIVWAFRVDAIKARTPMEDFTIRASSKLRANRKETNTWI